MGGWSPRFSQEIPLYAGSKNENSELRKKALFMIIQSAEDERD